MMAIPNETELQTQWSGVIITDAPETIPSSLYLADAKNIAIVGAVGGQSPAGQVKSRPGKRAKLSSALSGDVVACIRFRKPTGERYLLLAVATISGGSTANLCLWQYGANSTTALEDTHGGIVPFNAYPPSSVSGGGVAFERMGNYIYIIGAQDSIMRRMPLSAEAIEDASGLERPIIAPVILATNRLLGTNGYAQWSADYIAGSIPDVLNHNFDEGGDGLDHWTPNPGGTVEIATPTGGDNYVRLDDAPSWIISDRVTNAALTNDFDITTPSGSLPRYCRNFIFGAVYWTDANGSSDSVSVEIRLYSATTGGLPFATQSFEFAPGITEQDVPLLRMFSFEGVQPETAVSYEVKLTVGSHPRSGTNGPYLRGVFCQPHPPTTTFLDATGGVRAAVDILPTPTDPTQNNSVYWGGLRWSLEVDSTGGLVDLSHASQVNIPVSLGFGMDNLSFRMGFKAGATLSDAKAAESVISDLGQLLTTTSGQKYLNVDISNIDRSGLTNVRVVQILWALNGTVSTGYTNTGTPFSNLKGLVNGGSKASGLVYNVRFQEAVHGEDPAVRIESGFSPYSNDVQTDALDSTLQVTFPAKHNSTANAYVVGVEGGSQTDGLYYLEYRLPLATGVTDWPGLLWDGTSGTYSDADGYITWNPGDPTAPFLITDLPDSIRRGNEILYDHDPTPAGAQTIRAFQNRLWVTVGGDLYGSRLTIGVTAGLYWNLVSDSTSPDFSIAGYYNQIGKLTGATVGDSVVNTVVFQNRLCLFFAESLFILSGVDNADFTVRQYDAASKIGLIARNALAIVDGIGVLFLSATGLHSFNGASVSRELGLPVAKLLNPAAEFSGDALDATAYAKASILAHAGRVLVNIPTADSGSAIGQSLVWDVRVNQWLGRWTLGPVLCGESFSGSGEGGDLIICDANGMLSSLGNNAYGDTSTSGGAVTAVESAITTRRFTHAWAELHACRFAFSAASVSDDGTNQNRLSWSVNGDNGRTSGSDYQLALDGKVTSPNTPLFVNGRITGHHLSLSASWTTKNSLTISRLALTYAPGKGI